MGEENFPSSILDTTLYCEEEHLEEDCFIEEYEEDDDNLDPKKPPILLEQDLSWEEEELNFLLIKEKKEDDFCNNNNNGIQKNPSLEDSRSESVNWILKVSSYYSFSASTVILAVNYLDRFLFNFCSQSEKIKKKPWMTQLATVACLSLAAKVEETQAPLLLDLQVEECKYVFEAKTIQRMEILVLSTLEWKMNPVTPISFVNYVTRRLRLKNQACLEFLRRSECLLLSVISDCRFMCYLPSVMATATMLHVFDSVEPCLGLEYREDLLGILGTNKEKVEECYRLIPVVASAFYFRSSNKRKFRSLPGSPRGVMDMSFSSDCSNDSWSVVAAAASVSSSPEPLSKRNKSQATEDQVGQKP